MCGVRGIRIQRRLLAEPKLTLKRALDLALAIEAADKDASERHKADGQGGDASVNKVDVNVNKASKVECSRCGGNHCPQGKKVDRASSPQSNSSKVNSCLLLVKLSVLQSFSRS